MSLRGRLLLAFGAAALVALLAADVATYSALRSSLMGRLEQTLQSAHIPIEQALDGANSSDHGPGPAGGTPLSQVAPGTFVEVRTTSGQVVLEQPDYERGGRKLSPVLPARITGFSIANDPGGEPTVYFDAPAAQPGASSFLVRASTLHDGDVLVLAVPLADTNGTLRRLLWIELAATGGALLLAGLVGWWVVRLGLRPLKAIEETAGAIAEGRLSHRVPGEGRTEVGRLAGALNVMLDRIEWAFSARAASEARLRRFVGDASHELRTPVAAISAYAELFERGAADRPADLARVMSGIRGETARMGRLVEDLLLLARMDEGFPIDRQPVELVALAAEAVETARTVGPRWEVSLVAEHPVEVQGDRVRLRQVLDNLLANVRAHTPPGTSAIVTVGSRDHRAVVEVADNGPGITAEDAARVFERFFRADPSRSRASGGSGLGLSIVAAIVAGHGGTVGAAPAPAPPGGAVFTVELPRSDDAGDVAPDPAEPVVAS